MKILHVVSGSLSGGAARGAYWLHIALIELGVDSKILTNSNVTLSDENIITTSISLKNKVIKVIRSKLDKLLPIFYLKRKKIIFSSGMFGFDFTNTREYKEADIIHLHWVNDGFVNIKHLRKIDKPLVWTLRDMWPMTGGCHYSMECKNYKTGCGNCKQLSSSHRFDLSKFILNRKKKYLKKNIYIIGISRWLTEEAKKSELFTNFNISTIENNINFNEFFPINKNISKKILGIHTNKKIILSGSIYTNDSYKGFEKYLTAIKKIDNTKYFLCFFGNIDNNVIKNLGFEYKNFGRLYDNVSLRLVYSCANVFIAPSLMDAFGKTIAESMGCGTPVVCFNATGPKDIVDHKKNGYLAIPFQSSSIVHGIEWVLNNKNYSKLCIHARNKVIEKFDNKIIAQQYIKLYEEMLDG